MGSYPKPTIYLSYGFCEGPHVARSMAAALENTGFHIVKDACEAEIFLGHSGGCLLVPEGCTPRLTVFIGIPYNPGTPVLLALMRKNRREFRDSKAEDMRRWWWHKFAWNNFYFWNMRQNLGMVRHLAEGPKEPAGHTISIRNRYDDCTTEDIWQLPSLSDSSFISLPGEHDDLWMHPDVYAGIIKAYYGANILAPTKAK